MYLLILLLIVLIVLKIVYHYIEYSKSSSSTANKVMFTGSMNKHLLTETELAFYKKLKTVVDAHHMLLFSKVRMADIVKTTDYTSFNAVRSKHIDFIICDSNSSPLFFIELDDTSHTKNKNATNDTKKDSIFEQTNHQLMRVKLNEIDTKLQELEEYISRI